MTKRDKRSIGGIDGIDGVGADGRFSALEAALIDAAREFTTDAQPLAALLTDLAGDVDRAAAEPLEIFPVAHHSPASAVHMVARLRARAPRVIFVEMCEDLIAPVPDLADCTLPVALQAFAVTSDAFPRAWAPLSVVAPLTDLSAEYQAIAYASSHPETDLVFVDRSVDHVFQALPQRDEAVDEAVPDTDEAAADDDGAGLHGSAIGVELGSLIPSFGDFLEFLLVNARVAHFSEWWSLYVEQPVLGASHDTYRRVMFLVGSLIRRLGSSPEGLESDRMRERYMWTRMKDYLEKNEIAPADAIYICGAAHAASDVPEWGTARFGKPDDPRWDIPAPTATEWLYGFIPSSYSAIEHQFSHPRGTISLASETWKKAQTALKIKPFSLARAGKAGKAAKAAKPKAAKAGKAAKPASAPTSTSGDAGAADVLGLLTTPPALVAEDRDQLLGWCTEVVQLARKNSYLASTADSIAIYQTSVLLGSLRGRPHPSPADFTDAAITCLEKTAVPGRRSVQRLCEILLGADRIGQVGYSSLPPLVKDIYDRLAHLGVKPKQTTITRALMDFGANPGLRASSDLLWRLNFLLPGTQVARPIMGERVLGSATHQESWDIKLGGGEQRHVIQLAYEGVTVEQVLEKRLHDRAFSPRATTLEALGAAEMSILLLPSARLTEEIGERAVHLLTSSAGADDAQDIFDRVRRMVHHYRSTAGGLPHWLADFVATGYQHYATMLPEAFGDRGTRPEQVAGMLAFVFTLESLALTLGCSRSQLVISIDRAADQTSMPDKLGLLWAAEWLVERKDADAVRAAFDNVLDNPMSVSAFPSYLGGFLLALGFTSTVAQLGVELLSRAFAELSDAVLMPWLPGLIDTLRPRAHDIMPALLKEAQQSLPRRLADLDTWVAPWEGRVPAAGRATATSAASPSAAAAPTAPAAPALSAGERASRDLLYGYRTAADALAAALGATGAWAEPAEFTAESAGATAGDAAAPAGDALSPAERACRDLVGAHPAATDAAAARLGVDGTWTDTAPATAPAPAPVSTSAPVVDASADPGEAHASALLAAHGASAAAHAARLRGQNPTG